MLNDKAKDAIKIGLAFVLVYFFALQASWMNPYWAALAVVLCGLPTAGQSIHKGADRLAGSVPGCIVGLVIMALAPQNPYLFLLLCCAWLFFAAMMMLRSRHHSYMWSLAGFVPIIIAAAGPGSPAALFERATFRVLETMLGIVTFTLVSVFLWPRTNAGAIRKTAGQLVAAQGQRFRAVAASMAGRSSPDALRALHSEEIRQLTAFDAALLAEGSESYEVQEIRQTLDGFQNLSTAAMESLDRCQTGLTELARIDVAAVLPGLADFFAEIDARFEEMRLLFDGASARHEPAPVSLQAEPSVTRSLSHLDRAAVLVTVKELETLEGLTANMLSCVREIVDAPRQANAPTAVPPAGARHGGPRLPVIDPDHLRGALFVIASFTTGFLIWIWFDPPGHSGWALLAGSAALGIPPMQQARAIVFFRTLLVALTLALLVYVLILPQLSTFFGLGLTLFLCLFVNNYLFVGIGRLLGNMAIINMIPIQNHQTYSFAAMANSVVFMALVFLLLYAMTYLLRSPRPEKAVLALLRRYFRSAQFLIANLPLEPEIQREPFERWKIEFHRYELRTVPAKIGTWCRAIDPRMFPANGREQVEAMMGSLHALVHRIEELLEAAETTPNAGAVAKAMGDDLEIWRDAVATRFGQWSMRHETEPAVGLQAQLARWLGGVEQRIAAALDRPDAQRLSEQDGEGALRLLGGFRGVSNAAVAYAGAAAAIDWEDWRREVFR